MRQFVVRLTFSPTFSATRNTLSRTITYLSAGQTLSGLHWDYYILHPINGDQTHKSTVFKAQVISRVASAYIPRWAIVKAASPDQANSQEHLERECKTYSTLNTSRAGGFRTMYDSINNGKYLAMEYLDTTLADVPYRPDKPTLSIIQKVLDATLRTCLALAPSKLVNTDFKPANILLSDVGTDKVVAKVADFGLVFHTGERSDAQPHAMRAPEVFLGHPCTEASQIWAIAAMLTCWMKPGVLGVHDSIHFLVNNQWCMAKIKRLFPHWVIPSPSEVEDCVLQDAVQSAVTFSAERPVMQEILPFEQEMQKVRVPLQLIALLRYMLEVDPEERPSVVSVLQSQEYRAVQEL